MSIQHDVRDLNLADAGREALEWADRQTPILGLIRGRFTLGGVTLDQLTDKQEKYLASWEEGT